jgi:hypothetical protein
MPRHTRAHGFRQAARAQSVPCGTRVDGTGEIVRLLTLISGEEAVRTARENPLRLTMRLKTRDGDWRGVWDEYRNRALAQRCGK